MKAEFDRPIKGELAVILTNGESWEASDHDLEKFKVVRIDTLLNRIQYALSNALGGTHPGNTSLAPVWELIVTAANDPAKLETERGAEVVSRVRSIAEVEKTSAL